MTKLTKEELVWRKRARDVKYYSENRDRELERSRAHYAANRDRAAEKQRIRIKSDPEKHKKQRDKSRLLTRYGLSQNLFLAMLRERDGRCEICREIFSTKARMNIDHDHDTGNARSLLCHHCNRFISQGERNINWFGRARAYLKKYSTESALRTDEHDRQCLLFDRKAP